MVLGISEQAIDRYGPALVGRWAYLRTRCKRGVIFRGYDEQRALKVGYGRSKYFDVVRGLVAAGLAKKDMFGNYVLATTSVVKGKFKHKDVKHKCTLRIRERATEQEVIDLVRLKMVEMAHRQVRRKIVPELTMSVKQLAKLERTKDDRAKTLLLESPTPILGEARSETVKFATRGHVPLNTEKLMFHTGLGRHAMFAWKARAKRRKWISQRDRSQSVEPSFVEVLKEDLPAINKLYRGKLGVTRKDGWKFHQASTYKLLIQY